MEPFKIGRRPSILKDFLLEDLSSCSSSGFRSFPRRPSCYTSIRSLLEVDLKAAARHSKSSKKQQLQRSRSKAAAITTISAFDRASEAVINVVKHFSVKSPSKQGEILPKSFSRRLKRSFTRRSLTAAAAAAAAAADDDDEKKKKREIRVIVKVKHVLSWKSFRDLVEEEKQQKPVNHTALPTTTTCNSWSDSDFTTECLHSSSGSSSEHSGETEIIIQDCKNYLPHQRQQQQQKTMKKERLVVVGDSMTEKGESRDEEKDQLSPVSVLDCPFEDDDDSSSFLSSLDNMERSKQKFMQKIRRFESLAKIEPVHLEKRMLALELNDSLYSHSDSYSVSANNDTEIEQEDDEEYIKAEEKAKELFEMVTKTTSKGSLKGTTDFLLLDFFRDEIVQRNISKKMVKESDDDKELSKVATEWMNGLNGVLDWGVEESREVHYKEMEKVGRWSKFDEEQGELALDIEIGVLNSLLDEFVLDLLC